MNDLQLLHPDSQTTLADTDYFFLGSGTITAAIQWSRNPDATPLGVILQQPEYFTRKWGSYLFHPEYGLERTMLTVIIDGIPYQPKHHELTVEWSEHDGVPNVFAKWKAGEYNVIESFYVSPENHSLVRWVWIQGAADRGVMIETGLYANPALFSSFGAKENLLYAHSLNVVYLSANQSVTINERFISVTPEKFLAHDLEAHIVCVCGTSDERVDVGDIFEKECAYWDNTSSLVYNDGKSGISKLFSSAKIGLRAVVASDGRFDASVWQYGMQWVRDASRVAEALVYSGQFERAKAVLTNILTKLSNDDGMLAEASRFRGGKNSELDSNGLVLMALETYFEWTADEQFIKDHWHRITAIANYLLRPEFRDEKTGLLQSSRDIWERMEAMGIEPGYDAAHQTFAICGLRSAAQLAVIIGKTNSSEEWSECSERIYKTFTSGNSSGFTHEERVRKRVLLDGSLQTELSLNKTKESDDFFARFVPDKMPLADTGIHKLEPDVAQLLPIIFGIIDADSNVAKNTFGEICALWSQGWDGGGIGRYDISGEPDSPGPWSLATILFAQVALQCNEKEWFDRSIEWLIKKAGAGGSFFEFYGTRPTPPLPPVGVLPWSWAELIVLVVRDMLGATVKDNTIIFSPRVSGLSGSLRFRNEKISFSF